MAVTIEPEAGEAAAELYPLPPQFFTGSGRFQLAAKRALDVLGAGVGLIVLAPVFLAIAVAIRLDSRGPILYAWRVVGRRGRPFTGYKFRTMVPEADALYASLRDRNLMTGPVFKMKDDPRITRVGRFLRRHSLDELPQLWSVLTGEMSLVGPRPPLRREWEEFAPWQRQKLAVTPGITCLWQVSGRANITDFAEWARMDIEYIRQWNLRLDLAILWRTIGAVLSRQGAY